MVLENLFDSTLDEYQMLNNLKECHCAFVAQRLNVKHAYDTLRHYIYTTELEMGA